MRAAEVGVVDNVHVSGLQALRPLDDVLGAELHRAHEDRKPQLPLRDQFSGFLVVDAIGAVQRFRNHRTER